MITAFLALVYLQKISPSFNGVWVGPDGETVYLRDRGDCQMMLGERLINFDPPKQVPNGDFVAKWKGSRTLDIHGADHSTFPWEKYLEPNEAETVADHGEARVSYGQTGADGVVRSLYFQFFDGNGAKKLGQLFFFCTPLSRVNLIGHFSGPHASLDIASEAPYDRGVFDVEEPILINGKVTYNDSTYEIRGIRNGSRAAFEVVGAAYDNIEGRGYCVWQPTESRARKIQNRDERETDQVILYLKIKGLPNGSQMVLKRTPKS